MQTSLFSANTALGDNGKRRVLFVDDDASVLNTLRDMLEDQTEDWDMQFVNSGVEALLLVDSWAPHVVVSDMQMPGMDGSALLQQVRLQHPSALRILLSGHAASRAASNVVDDSGKFLQKPLRKSHLVGLIDDATRVEALVPDAALRNDIAALSRLPMLKPAERQLIGEIDRPNASLKRAAEMVECDPGLAAMALRMVRSASVAMPQRVERPGQAALMLGFDNLRGLVLAAGSFRSFDPGLQALAEQLALVGAGIAAAARREAAKQGASSSQENEAFTAGLLNGIGVLVLTTLRPDLVAQWQLKHPCEWPADQDEFRHFGATYAGAGAYLLALWGFPAAIVNAVAWHLSPAQGAPSAVLSALSTVTLPQNAPFDRTDSLVCA